MSLKGSLQTVALPEVLNLLADTRKSGELHVSGAGGEGRIWFADGSIHSFEVKDSEEAFEAIFELLRLDDGEFSFAADEVAPDSARMPGDSDREVGMALEKAQTRLAEWREIVAVIPSLAHFVELTPEAPEEKVELDRTQWSVVVAVGDGRSAGQALDACRMREFDGCRTIRTLADASLVRIGEPAASPEAADELVDADPHVVDPAGIDPVPVEDAVMEYSRSDVAADEAPSTEPFSPEAFSPEAFSTEFPSTEPERVASPFMNMALGFGMDSSAIETPSATSVDHVIPDGTEPLHDEPQYDEPLHDEGDRYASLRAAVIDVGTDLQVGLDEPGEGAQDGDAPASEHEPLVMSEPGGGEGRAALRALLTEVTSIAPSEEVAASESQVDGLVDRGPWTSRELADLDHLGGWRDEDETVPVDGAGSPAEDVHEVVGEDTGEAVEGAEEQPADEPINRGLLLKFLSSVRN